MKLAFRIFRWTLFIGVIAALAYFRPDRAFQTASGLTAHNLCDAVFTQHLDAEATMRELVRPMASVAGPLLHYDVDRKARSATASVAGLFPARAEWTQGYGCRLIFDPAKPRPEPLPPSAASAADDGFAPATVVAPSDPEIAAAFERLFSEPKDHLRQVKAVVIVKDGKVVAERYAPGFGPETPLLSYSVAKSFTNAFLGILVRQGKLRVDEPVGAKEWKAGDPRAAITIDDLLRMRSGLDADENGSGFDPASQMLYAQDDMAGFCAGHKLAAPVGTRWRYTSCNTLILDRRLSQTVGGGPAGFARFADQELFGPARMSGVTIEFDGTGVFSGSAHVYAPARSYARFGLLFLKDGLAPDGSRILPEGWAAYSRRSTLDTEYGSGFWTLDGPSLKAKGLQDMGFPADGFYASGNLGQRIYIVPSENLVMVRSGYTHAKGFDIAADMDVLKTAIARLKQPG